MSGTMGKEDNAGKARRIAEIPPFYAAIDSPVTLNGETSNG